jgi:23S rRNA (cytosine1962-C5)-methyltransferase
VTIREHDWRLTLDVAEGHKTGFYLDQRDNRARFALGAPLGAQRVLNCYCYTGGFSVAALAGGAAHVTSVDSSGPALARARRARGGSTASTPARAPGAGRRRQRRSCASSLKAGAQFDAIVLDPPKFAPSAAHAERAARAYKDINRLALKLLAPGGLLLTFVLRRHRRGPVPQDRRRRRGHLDAGCETRAWHPADQGARCRTWRGAEEASRCDHPTSAL